LKCLTVTDEWTNERLAIEVAGRIRSAGVIEVLSRLVSERGAPRYLRSDAALVHGLRFAVRDSSDHVCEHQARSRDLRSLVRLLDLPCFFGPVVT
jgi:hypothetical protein